MKTTPLKGGDIRNTRVLESISIKPKRRNGTNGCYLLKLDDRPIGTYTDAWLNEGLMSVSMLERTRLSLRRSGSNWALIADRSGSNVCTASYPRLLDNTLELKLSTCKAKLRPAGGFLNSAAVLELDEWSKIAKVNRVLSCRRSWRLTGVADLLHATDMVFVILIYHALDIEVCSSGP